MSSRINPMRLVAALAALALWAACGTADETYVDSAVAGGDVDPSLDSMMATMPSQVPTTDAGIIELELSIDRSEVQAANLALERARDADVKEFARQMVEDHAKDTTAIGQLALRENIVATGTVAGGGILESMKESHERTMEVLRSSTGAEFDRAYMDAMVARHQQVLDVLQHAHHGVQNAQLQNHVSAAISMVQRHLERALEVVRTL